MIFTRIEFGGSFVAILLCSDSNGFSDTAGYCGYKPLTPLEFIFILVDVYFLKKSL